MTATGTSKNVQPIVPKPNDILCGTGKAVMNHPGNKAFRALVKESVRNYSESHSSMKAQIKENIVKAVLANNGRFVKKSPDGSWCILKRDEAEEKTSQALRDAKRNALRDNNPEVLVDVPVNHQSLDHDPMQSISMATSWPPISILDVVLPAAVNESGQNKKDNVENDPSVDDSEDINTLASMFSSKFSVHMSHEGLLSIDDSEDDDTMFSSTLSVQSPEGLMSIDNSSEAISAFSPSMFAVPFSHEGLSSMDDNNFLLPSSCNNITSTENSTAPNESDVLCGSGKGLMNHPGNRKFRDMVKAVVTSSLDAPGHMKTQISENIVQNIKNHGGRFLKQHAEGVWCPITHVEAVNKTLQALRDAKRLALRQQSTEQNPNLSAKKEPVVSAPMPMAPYFILPFSKENFYYSTVAEVASDDDLSITSLDVPISILTFATSENMDSIIETLDNVYVSEVFEGNDGLWW